MQPPITDPTEQISANLNDFLGAPIERTMSKTSGGIGKKEDSPNASRNNANAPYGVSAQWSTQS
jgi:hypothetical protein